MTHREITTHGWTVDDHRRAERIRTDRGMPRMVIFDEVDSVQRAWSVMFAPRVTTTVEGGLTITKFTRRPGFALPHKEEAP